MPFVNAHLTKAEGAHQTAAGNVLDENTRDELPETSSTSSDEQRFHRRAASTSSSTTTTGWRPPSHSTTSPAVRWRVSNVATRSSIPSLWMRAIAGASDAVAARGFISLQLELRYDARLDRLHPCLQRRRGPQAGHRFLPGAIQQRKPRELLRGDCQQVTDRLSSRAGKLLRADSGILVVRRERPVTDRTRFGQKESHVPGLVCAGVDCDPE